jgi:hypothetical protein
MVGLAIADNNDNVGYIKSFKSDTDSKNVQASLAILRAVSFMKANRIDDGTGVLNVYSDWPINMDRVTNNEYLRRSNLQFYSKQACTDSERNVQRTADTSISLELRRQAMGIYIGR